MEQYEGMAYEAIGGEGYSRDKIYSRGTNQHGLSKDVRLCAHPEVVAQAQRIVNHPNTDYDSLAAFVRDAMIHRVADYHDKLDGYEDETMMMFVLMEDRQYWMDKWQSLVDGYKKQFKQGKSDLGMQLVILNALRVDIEKVPKEFEGVREKLVELIRQYEWLDGPDYSYLR